MGSEPIKISTKYGIIGGISALLIIICGLFVMPVWTLALTLIIFISCITVSMYLGARRIKSLPVFVGFNDMLKPMFRSFVIGLLIYYIGFLLYEFVFYPDLYKYRTEMSYMLLEMTSSWLNPEQMDLMKEGIELANVKPDFSIKSVLMNLVLYFAALGVPLSITIAALANRGFSNIEQIVRNNAE